MAELEAGEQIPELRVTPDKYLTVRYAGASGDFNPIHIDEEFARAVGLPGRILHGLWTMAQVARAQTEAAGGPEQLQRLSVQFRGMGVPEQEIVVTGTVRELRRRARDRRHRRRAGRQADHPQRRGRARALERGAAGAAAAGAPPTIRAHAHAPARSAILSKVVEDYLRTGQPVASRIARGRPRPRLRALDGAQRTRPARGARPARPPARLGGTGADRRRPALRRRPSAAAPAGAAGAARRLELTLIRREVDDAMRAITETLSQMTNLLAVVSAPAINTATVRHVEVLDAAAAARAGRDHHLRRAASRRCCATLRAARSIRASWPGRASISTSASSASRSARGCCRQRLADPSLSARELRLPRPPRAGLRRARRRRRGRAVRRWHRAAVRAPADRGCQPGQRADRRCSSGAWRCCGCCARALGEPGVYVRIGRENELPAMQSLAVVATGYGVAQRKLGTVSVIGPVRMDYAGAIATVREAAHELSRFVEDAYAEN